MRRAPLSLLRARLLALFAFSLVATYGSALALHPGRLERPVERIWPAAALAAGALGGAALQDRLAFWVERAGRARLQAAGWLIWGAVFLALVLGAFLGARGREAVDASVTLLRVSQPAFLLLAGLGRGSVGALANAFVLSGSAALGGGIAAALTLTAGSGFLAFFLGVDHHARQFSDYPVDSAPGEGAALRRSARWALGIALPLAVFFAAVPPRPYAPFEAAAPGGPGLPPDRLAELLGHLFLIAVLASAGFYLLLRFGTRGGGAAPEGRVEKVAARRKPEPAPPPAATVPAGPVGGWRSRIVRLFLRTAERLGRLGRRRRPEQTAFEYARTLPWPDAARALAELFVRARYGPEEPSEADYQAAVRASRDVLDRARGSR
jgi:hypothetical protein